jgi:hypothetical protein
MNGGPYTPYKQHPVFVHDEFKRVHVNSLANVLFSIQVTVGF